MPVLLALLSGSAMTLAFAPFNQWYIAVLGVAILSWLWLHPAIRCPGRIGFVFGVGYFGTGLHWVYISLYAYGGASLGFAVLANIILILFLATFTMLTGWLLGKLTRPATLSRLLLIPLLWSIAELARAHILGGFPWLSIGYSQLNGPLDGLAPLTGVFGISMLTLFIAALFAYAVIIAHSAPVAIAVVLLTVTFISRTLHFTNPVGNRISVALVQGNIAQNTKFDPKYMFEGLLHYVELSASRRESVIIWPETAIPFMRSDIEDSHLRTLNERFLSKDQTLVTGIPSGNWDEQLYFNSVITLGTGQGDYVKHHLLPFGEYLPLRPLFSFFDDFVDIPFSDFTSGAAKQAPIVTSGIRAGVSICFEAAFGRNIRQSLPDAQYLINISNDGWFKDSIAADQHLQMVQMRARELEREVARATNNGITAFIDARGNINARLPRFESGVLSGHIQPYIGLTPYARYGNTIFAVILALYAMIAGFYIFSDKRHASTVSSQRHRA